LARSARLTWTDILTEQLIVMTRESGIRFLVDQTYLSLGKSMRPAYEVSHMTTAVMLVEAGLGVAVLPAYVWRFARASNVVPKVLCDPEVRREVSIAQSSVRTLSPAAEAFVQSLRKRAHQALPRGLRYSFRK
jgi:DNA-binding transcriptional LysR family regulator